MKNVKYTMLFVVLLLVLVACVSSVEEAAVQYVEVYQIEYTTTELVGDIAEDIARLEEYWIEEYEPFEQLPIHQFDIGTLTGIFILEGEEDLMTLEFENNEFIINMSYASLELGFDIPGYISIGGTFTVYENANIISLNVDADYVFSIMREAMDVIVDHIIKNDPTMQDELEDSETLQILVNLISVMVEGILEEVVDEFVGYFEDLYLMFYGTFDRLYSGDEVFIRR